MENDKIGGVSCCEENKPMTPKITTETKKCIIEENTVVTPLIAQWISHLLDADESHKNLPPRQLPLDENLALDLKHLKLKDLKRICKEMQGRIRHFQCNEGVMVCDANRSELLSYSMPRSNAKKAEWVNSVWKFFHEHQNDHDVYRAFGFSLSSVRASEPTISDKVVSVESRSKGAMSERRKECSATPRKCLARQSEKSRSAKRKANDVGGNEAEKSVPKKKSKSTLDFFVRAPTSAKMIPYLSTQKSIEADKMLEKGINSSMSSNKNKGYEALGERDGASTYPPTRCLLDNSSLACLENDANYDTKFGVKRDCRGKSINVVDRNLQSTPSIKMETEHDLQQSDCSLSNRKCTFATFSTPLPDIDESLEPFNDRERVMLNSLRTMGFTNIREMITGLRAVEAKRVSSQKEKTAILSDTVVNSDLGQWSMQEQVEAAMMWIVAQHEEADEARKLDEARILSEKAIEESERCRREEAKRQLENANLFDLIGSVDENESGDGNQVGVSSKFFPSSVILRNNAARKIFAAIAGDNSKEDCKGKEEVVRLLTLEKNARKWYGTVLPFPYFMYVLSPRFEIWYEELPNKVEPCGVSAMMGIRQKLSHESETLEKAMYNLSEQEEGGVGKAPKLFLVAQREASNSGRPLSLPNDEPHRNSDVEILTPPPTQEIDFCVEKKEAVGNPQFRFQQNTGSDNRAADVVEII